MDNVHVEGDPGVFVTTIKLNGAAAMDGRMQPGDKILEVSQQQQQHPETHCVVNGIGCVCEKIP